MKTLIKELFFVLVFLGMIVTANAQIKIHSFNNLQNAIARHGIDYLPLDEKNNASIVGTLTRWDTYDVGYISSSFKEDKSISERVDTYIRLVFEIPSNKLLCCVSRWEGDYNSSSLIIVSDYSFLIQDELNVGNALGIYSNKQFLIREGGGKDENASPIVCVYSFVPNTSEQIDLMDFSNGSPSSLTGRIKLEEYEIHDSHFTLVNTSWSSTKTISHSDFEDGQQLWDLF